MPNSSVVKPQIKSSSDVFTGEKKAAFSLRITDELFSCYYHLERRSESHC